MQRTTDRKFKYLLQKKGRIDKNIDDLISRFKQKPFKKPFISILKNPIGKLSALKFMMVLHNLIYEKLIDSNTCEGYLKQIIFKIQGTAQKYMVEQFLNPYRLYLQKRNCNSNNNQMDEHQQTEMELFKLINQIKLVGSFSQIIYTFGRYYPQYQFIIDFNVIIAKDVKQMYMKIQKYVKNQQKYLMQIQFLHQVMYPIYFNNYYYRQIYSYRPKWISTDNVLLTPSKNNLAKIDSTAQNTNQSHQKTSYIQEKVSQFNTYQEPEQPHYISDLTKLNHPQQQFHSQFALFDIADIDQDLSLQQDPSSIHIQIQLQ